MNETGSPLIFWLLGAVFIAFGLYSGVRRRKLSRSEHTVQGTIVRYEEMADTGIERGSTGFKYYPVVRFDTPSGTVQEVSRIGASMRGEDVGTTVEVHYDPEDPSRFELLGGNDMLKRQTVPIALGVAFLAIGAALLF